MSAAGIPCYGANEASRLFSRSTTVVAFAMILPTMQREEILDAIRDYAKRHDGIAPGIVAFTAECGLKPSHIVGRHWARWSDAVAEAGLVPLTLQQRRSDDETLRYLATLLRDLGHLPTKSELRLAARRVPGFPSHSTFDRLGTSAARAEALEQFCDAHSEFADVVQLVRAARSVELDPAKVTDDDTEARATDGVGTTTIGFVYPARSGRHHKVGKTNSVGRRMYELGIQLPEKLDLVHYLATDDPDCIERYWHERFASKRLNGEWFALTRSDIAAFRRRGKYM
jgi:Meiotically up-regulated gene 113